MISIRRTLLVALIATILGTVLVIALWSYRENTHEVAELFDAELAQMTRVLQGLLRGHADDASLTQLSISLRHFEEMALHETPEIGRDNETFSDHPGHRYESKIAFQVWRDQNGEVVTVHAGLMPMPKPEHEGFSWIEAGQHRWRTFTLHDTTSGLWVRAAQRYDVRQELTHMLGRSMLLPLLWMIPILLAAIFAVITWGLRPLKQLEGRVRAMRPEQLRPIALMRAPREVQALVSGLNALLQRLQETLEHEKRFTADAAHELRTPLAALKLHLQNAMAQPQPELRPLLSSVERMTHLVEQMLTLSRLDPQQHLQQRLPVELRQVAETVLADLAPIALARGIEPELHASTACPVAGDAALLEVLLRNLVDNALRYSPANTNIDVYLQEDEGMVELLVMDQGPGVAPALREKLLERFVRGDNPQVASADRNSWETGSGLGLSIVQRIAELHEAQLQLLDRPGGGQGLCVSLRLPRA